MQKLAGVVAITPDLMRRQVRVEHAGLDAALLLETARQSGLEVQPAPAAAGVRSTLTIANLCCATEEALIRKRLAGEAAVQDLQFRPLQRQLLVTHEAGGLPRVLAALDEIGMHGVPENSDFPQPAAKTTPPPHGYARLILAALLTVAAEGIALAHGENSPFTIALALAAIALTGLGTFRKGWYALRQGNLNINALMSAAVIGAGVLGQWPEAAMVMALFALAEAIEARSLDRARHAVESLMAMTPETATVQMPGGWQTLPAREVVVGSLARVKPGERIALDGRVASGQSAVDQSPITGESVPVDKTTGDELFAGSINQDGELQYRVTAAADNSTLARIIRTVQDAQASRAPTQRQVDVFARYYTPAVFLFAVLIALVPPLAFGGEWQAWFYRALVMLVVACPCALVISTPVSIVSGLTAAARRGILIKGGLHLEQGARLQVLALDKTGTLTRGHPELVEVLPLQGNREEALRMAATLATRNDHPVSRAIAAAAMGALPDIGEFKALPGRGVEGTHAGARYRLGNQRLLRESGAGSEALDAQLAALEAQGRTVVALTSDAQPLALFALADTLRPQTPEAVAQLKALGIQPLMLTGDNRHTAEAIAREAGIAEVRAELLPEDKLAAIAMLAEQGQVVGMAGDGINDAPALARAHVGFAMGAAGTDTAIETADVALMDDDPRKLAEFIRLARRTRGVLWQNITLAIGIKAVFLALAISGHATLWMAVFADMGSSLLVVGNGLRLLRNRHISADAS
ncbi:heavy metal translocating P-type ATPase [Niveibacterium sp. SC-1]|uniref:heavy metal translocating P-type ATPase n=1 Tax=Niveibacterium sp. SC-1 TaxID=3135646 RepID=UPI00312039DA